MQNDSDSPGAIATPAVVTSSAKQVARRVTVTYLLLSILWIWLSDWFLMIWHTNFGVIRYAQTLKGMLFVVVTATILYQIVYQSVNTIQRGQAALLLGNNELRLMQQQLEQQLNNQKQVETALRQSEEKFRRAVVYSPFPTMIHAEDGEVLQINQAWIELTGYSEQEIPTIADWTERAYGNRKDIVQADIDRLYSLNERENQGEYAITTKDGAVQIWEFSSAPLGRLYDGRRMVISVAKDVTARVRLETERQRAEAEIRQLNANLEQLVALRTIELESLINALPDYIFMVERDTMRIPFCNDVFAQGIGMGDRSQVQGKTVFECFPAVDSDYFRGQNQQVFKTGQTLHMQETIVLPDGPHHFETFKVPLRRPDGTIYALVGISRDFTNLIEAQHSLAKRTTQLEASNRELDSFSYSVSHDLRAPLRHIGGFVSALENHLRQTNKLEDPKVIHYLKVIQDSSQKMGQLIDGLLTLSRVGRRQMAEVPVDLNRIVQDVLTQFPETAATDALPPSTSQPPIELVLGDLPTVTGDPTLLQQVFVNLLSNAIKFSRNSHPARIEIGTLPDGIVFVRDNGVGFQMTYADQLFGAFQRLHAQSEFEGTGIGLAIVQRIVRRHGGMIWADSQPHQGATFYLKLGNSMEK